MTVTTRWDLFEDLHAVQDELQRAAEGRSWRPGQQYEGSPGIPVWTPTVDISERKDAYLVTAELPGVAARLPCLATWRRTISKPRRRTACCRSWCPRHPKYRPGASRCAPARDAPWSKAQSATAADTRPCQRLPSPVFRAGLKYPSAPFRACAEVHTARSASGLAYPLPAPLRQYDDGFTWGNFRH
jgi:hypothetical protein